MLIERALIVVVPIEADCRSQEISVIRSLLGKLVLLSNCASRYQAPTFLEIRKASGLVCF